MFHTLINTTNKHTIAHSPRGTQSNLPRYTLSTSNSQLASPRYMARLLVVLPHARLRMVAFDRRHIPQRILVTTQCYFLDED